MKSLSNGSVLSSASYYNYRTLSSLIHVLMFLINMQFPFFLFFMKISIKHPSNPTDMILLPTTEHVIRIKQNKFLQSETGTGIADNG